MIHKHKPTNIFVMALLVALVGLTGCSLSSETPTEATPTQVSVANDVTVVPESAGVVETPVVVEGTPTAVEESVIVEETLTTVEEVAVENTATAESVAQDAVCTKLNLNDLTADQLTSTIPDFSSRMVREFLEYRPYVSIQQFRREIGKYVDASLVTEYEKYVYVPVDPNEADAATLMQLPGADSTIAEQLTSGRPYASNDAFLQTLAAHVNEQQLAEAKCYLVVK